MRLTILPVVVSLRDQLPTSNAFRNTICEKPARNCNNDIERSGQNNTKPVRSYVTGFASTLHRQRTTGRSTGTTRLRNTSPNWRSRSDPDRKHKNNVRSNHNRNTNEHLEPENDLAQNEGLQHVCTAIDDLQQQHVPQPQAHVLNNSLHN